MQFLSLDPASFTYGEPAVVLPGVRRVIAENPSKFTDHGTGTYVVGEGDVVVIDPGPKLDQHRQALAAALAGERVRAVLVTHCHADHSPLAAWLAAESGAPTVAYGPHPPDAWDVGADPDPLTPDPDTEAEAESESTSAPDPRRLRRAGEDGEQGERDGDRDANAEDAGAGERDGEQVVMEEAVDRAFVPDVEVRTGDVVAEGRGWSMTALHTPGHTSNHTCFTLDDGERRVLFTGDHVMGWSTTVVSPPDGDMAAYLESLRAVAGRSDDVALPTHGPPIPDPASFVEGLLAHRLERERQVLEALGAGLATVPEIVARLYVDVPVRLHRPAGRSVLAHLVQLVDEGRVAQVGADAGQRPRLDGRFRLV